MPTDRLRHLDTDQSFYDPRFNVSPGPTDITALRGGGYVVVSSTSNTRFGFSSSQAAQVYDSSGNLVRSIGLGSGEVGGFDIQALDDGGFAVAFGYRNFINFVDVSRFSSNGDLVWTTSATDFSNRGSGVGLAVLPNGNLVAAFEQVAGIQYQMLDPNGQKIGSAVFAHDPNANAVEGTPAITSLAGGGFVMTWAEVTNGGSASEDSIIKAQLFDAAGNRVGAALQVASQTDGLQADPSIVGLESGGFVIAWQTSPLGSATQAPNYDIHAQIFGPSGTPVGTEFLVNDIVAGNQTSPELASLPGGGFIVTWDNGVNNQIYSDDGTRVGDNFVLDTAGLYNGSVTALANGQLQFAAHGTFIESNVQSAWIQTERWDWITSYSGTAGSDTLGGSLINDTFSPGAGVDFVTGFAGVDTVNYSDITSNMEINLTAGWSWDGATMDFLNSIESAVGGTGSDYMTGTDANNLLSGGTAGTDFIHGLNGSDTVSYIASASGVQIYLDQQHSFDGVTMDFMSSIENAIGSANDDYIVGDAGDNMLDGGTGGVDFLIGGDGVDTVSYQHAVQGVQIYLDQQHGWDGATMDFLSSIERGVGSAFNDLLVGSSGADRLNGWLGNDDMIGGAGADIFEFGHVDDSFVIGNDRILDFQSGSDKIWIDSTTGPVDSFADLLANSFQSGSDTVIRLNDQSSIMLVGVSLGTLTATDFAFG